MNRVALFALVGLQACAPLGSAPTAEWLQPLEAESISGLAADPFGNVAVAGATDGAVELMSFAGGSA
jgi:hypothetical protein